jgi:hypothetical protein
MRRSSADLVQKVPSWSIFSRSNLFTDSGFAEIDQHFGSQILRHLRPIILPSAVVETAEYTSADHNLMARCYYPAAIA